MSRQKRIANVVDEFYISNHSASAETKLLPEGKVSGALKAFQTENENREPNKLTHKMTLAIISEKSSSDFPLEPYSPSLWCALKAVIQNSEARVFFARSS
jgi:hypothetical protein